MYTQEFEYPKIRDVLLLGKLWILAERAIIPKLQNTTIDVLYPILRGPMVAFPSRTPDMQDLVDIVFGEHTEEHPILRSLLVDYFASLHSRRLDDWAEHIPQKLLVQLTKTLAKDREDSRGKHRSVLATGKKATDYYVEVPTEKKDDAAKSQRKAEKKSANKPRQPSSNMLSGLHEPLHSNNSRNSSGCYAFSSDEEVEDLLHLPPETKISFSSTNRHR